MSFVVETGAALSTATSYASVAEADAYHTIFGNEVWTSAETTPSMKESALIQASKALDLLYGQEYLSMPVLSDQGLLFPRLTFIINRNQVVSSTTIPRQLKEAVYELALKQLLGTNLLPTPNEEGDVESRSIKIDVISEDIKYRKSSTPTERFVGFWKIDQLLKPLLRDRDSNATLFGL